MEWSDHPEFISGTLCRKLPLYSKKNQSDRFRPWRNSD